MTRVALDTNILAYFAGAVQTESDVAKAKLTRSLIARLADTATVITPVQALGELFVVLRRTGLAAKDVRTIIIELAETFATPASEANTLLAAMDLSADHNLQFWDSLILAAAAESGATIFLSEDMQHGFVTRGLTIINPLRDDIHPKLGALL